MVQDLIADVLTWAITNPLESVGVIIILLFLVSPMAPKKTNRDAFPEGVNGEAF